MPRKHSGQAPQHTGFLGYAELLYSLDFLADWSGRYWQDDDCKDAMRSARCLTEARGYLLRIEI
jgi:hypothetical protein